MHQQDPRNKVTPSSASDEPQSAVNLGSAIIPRSVRLEPIHPNRERSISEAIENAERDPFDRIGLASERVVDSVLSSHVKMDFRRVLAWSTQHQARHTIELDGVAREGVFLEYKLTFAPERAGLQCRKQLVTARDVYLAGQHKAECRGVGVVVDCGSLVGLPPPTQVSTIQSVVDAIRNGVDKYSVNVVPFEEVADYFRRSKYGALLSAECLREAYLRRMKSERPPQP